MSKEVIGKKGSVNESGYKFAPYIPILKVNFPEITFGGYDKNGNPIFKKIKQKQR